MADAFDRRPERSFFARRLIERLVKHPDIELILVHFTPMPDEPLYKEAREILLPKISLPWGSRFASFMYFCLTTKEKFDIFQYLVGRPYPFFWLFPAKKFVILAHDAGVARVPGSRTIPNIISYLTLRFFHRHVDLVVGVSEYARKEIQDVYRLPVHKTAYVYNGIDPVYQPLPDEEFAPVLEKHGLEKGSYIFYLGGLQRHKNIPRLIEAYNILRAAAPHIRHKLILGGTPTNAKDPVYKAAKRSLYKEDIRFLGFVEKTDVPALHNGAVVFVFPSLHEGFGMPPVEAMACGTPTVVSNATSLPEVTGGASILVNPHDPSDMARGMREVLESSALQGELREKGFANVQKFSWDEYVRKHVELYKKLLGYSEA